MRRIAFIFLILIFLTSAYLGIANGLHDFQYSESKGQFATSLSVISYGITSLVVLLRLIYTRKWTFIGIAVWGVFCALAAGGATLFFGKQTFLISIVAGLSTLLVTGPVLLIAWWLNRSSDSERIHGTEGSKGNKES